MQGNGVMARTLIRLGVVERADGTKTSSRPWVSALAAALIAFLVASEPLRLGLTLSLVIALAVAGGTWVSVRRP